MEVRNVTPVVSFFVIRKVKRTASPICNRCRSCVSLGVDSELFQCSLDLPPVRVVKLQREGLSIVRNGPFILADKSQRIGAARKMRANTGIEPDRFVEVLYRAIIPLHSRVHETAIVEGNGVVGIEPDGLVKILDGETIVP